MAKHLLLNKYMLNNLLQKIDNIVVVLNETVASQKEHGNEPNTEIIASVVSAAK